jgi:hypothetical protein
MKPMVLLFVLSAGATPVLAQQRETPEAAPTAWLTADSLARAVGVEDSAVVSKIAVHLGALDRSIAGGEGEQAVARHLSRIRDALPEENRPAFDRLHKPTARRQRPGS